MGSEVIRNTNIVLAFFLVISINAFSSSDPSLEDGKARVYSVEGYATVTHDGNPIEKNLKIGNEIIKGDIIETRQGASVSIQFDNGLKNAVRIPENSRAIFNSIEPTVIEIEDGAIFNIVDGLAEGSTWKVQTPGLVAAVRGAVFYIRYGISNGEYYAATVNIPDDGKNSAIEISSLTHGRSVRIIEGKGLGLKGDQVLSEELLGDIDETVSNNVLKFYTEIIEERPREDSEAMAAAPIAEFVERTCDARGENCSTRVCKMTESGKICDYAS